MANSLQTPFPMFFNVDGSPLDGGYLFIGVAGLNPLSNPQAAYWDELLTVPAINVRISGGFVINNGKPDRLYMAGDFSLLVQDKNGKVIYSKPNGFIENADLFLTFPRGSLTRAMRTPLSFNFNLILESGLYSWTNALTTNKPVGTAAADLFALTVRASPDGTGLVQQHLFDMSNGPTGKYEFQRQSLDAGVNWTAWRDESVLAPPIGFVYFQGPHDASPGTLWPTATWSNVSSEEAGLTRRAEGRLAAAFLGGITTPAVLSISVAAGVPTVAVVSGGAGYLAGGSGTIPLVVTGTCATQYVGNATVTNGVITAIPAPGTPGVGYTNGACAVYDGVVAMGDKFEGHAHPNTGYAGPNFIAVFNAGTSYTAPTYNGTAAAAIITTDAVNGGVRFGPETTAPYNTVRKWRRTA